MRPPASFRPRRRDMAPVVIAVCIWIVGALLIVFATGCARPSCNVITIPALVPCPVGFRFAYTDREVTKDRRLIERAICVRVDSTRAGR